MARFGIPVPRPSSFWYAGHALSGRQKTLIAAVLIAAAAIFLRVYAIDRLPPGLFGDEAVEGLDALDVLAGHFAIWFHAQQGREPIYVYLVALSYRAFGVTPLATRLPAVLAGLATVPAAFFFVLEWAAALRFSGERAMRLALFSTALLAISFWHVQMSRDAHRDTLLPLVEAVGYAFLWRGIRKRDWKAYAVSGAALALSVYTYSPGRFVVVLVAAFVAVEFLVARLGAHTSANISKLVFDVRGLGSGAALAIVVMLPLGVYFLQNPTQFSLRFQSVSVFDFPSPPAAIASSVVGNLAQFVVPGHGYESKHYNLPGTPVFDLLIAPWFLAGVAIAFARTREAGYRFLVLWFVVMATPAFLTADMIPKGVRVLGVIPGIFVFPSLAMDWIVERCPAASLRRRAAIGLIALSIIGSAIWTTYDYFVAWASLPELPLAFDADQFEVASFVHRQPADSPIFISQETYRPPTLMLLGERVPTSRYVDRATRIREFDARTTLVFGASSDARYVFDQDWTPPGAWLSRIVPRAQPIVYGDYFTAYRLPSFNPPVNTSDVAFDPLLELVGYTCYVADPQGIALYWVVRQLPPDRMDIRSTLSLVDAGGGVVAQSQHNFGVPPLDWAIGDQVIEWYSFHIPQGATRFNIQLTRGTAMSQSSVFALK